ncbi:protein-tyrosine-phosphatase PTP1-like isoform X3 [Papaver somniferum]|uniref:protein-tyrosine-phosphatase PTP1-like isoform X3 n=1 Tax=Papaver somniferum TaxID=3469 RepID=UPI000E702A43|nr:protein-tyrosine-phosphatase PTP1-like isoform X3 [Papaver somniferum]
MVVLKSTKDSKTPGSDYINASFLEVSSCESNPRIIAAQGPLRHTCEDFWEMVIQYHCPLIVMLTQLMVTRQVIKCHFQSEDSPIEFGKIHVTTRWKRTTNTLLVLRRLEVTHREVLGEQVHFVQFLILY